MCAPTLLQNELGILQHAISAITAHVVRPHLQDTQAPDGYTHSLVQCTTRAHRIPPREGGSGSTQTKKKKGGSSLMSSESHVPYDLPWLAPAHAHHAAVGASRAD